jgi:ribulose-5-phosphate 4-epimerase/fuculose-1-phosphate aldolase
MNLARREFLGSMALALAGTRVAKLCAQTAQPNQIEDLVLANRILADHEVFDAYGHVSVRSERDPQRFFMARSLAPALVTRADILEYDLDCNVVGGTKQALFLERFIHGEIYRARPDVKSVVHCHTPSVIPFGDTDVPLRPMFGLSGFLAGGVPVFEIRKGFGATDLLIRDQARARALVQTLGNRPVALMRGHGAVVTGSSLQLTVGRCIYLDLNARVQLQTIALVGAPGGKNITYITPEEGKQTVADDYRRGWELWRREALAKMNSAAK